MTFGITENEKIIINNILNKYKKDYKFFMVQE